MTYAAAWYIDSPTAVERWAAAGGNAYIVPAGLAPAVLDATLAAVPEGHAAILNVNGMEYADAMNLIVRVRPRIQAVLTFDEPNLDEVPVSITTQRQWYAAIKAIGPALSPPLLVLVDYFVSPSGVPNSERVDNQPGLSWDLVCCDIYPAHWGISGVQTARDYAKAIRAACACFAHSNILPIMQAACDNPGTTGQLAPMTARELAAQYEAWYAAGKISQWKAICFYGWKTPENQCLSNNPVLLDVVTEIVAEHHARLA